MPNNGGYARLSAIAQTRFEALCAIRGRLRRSHRQALDGTAHALREGSMDPAIPGRHLLYLDLSAREPLAAIVVGDLDTATHVTWQLSGTGIRARNALWGSVREAGQLYLEQRTVGVEEPAVVAWLGYRSPNMLSALLNGSAHRGVEILERDLETFAALRHGEAVPGTRSPFLCGNPRRPGARLARRIHRVCPGPGDHRLGGYP